MIHKSIRVRQAFSADETALIEWYKIIPGLIKRPRVYRSDHRSRLHREDGPALYLEGEENSGNYYLNGMKLSYELWSNLVLGPPEKLPLFLGQGCDSYIAERLKENE